MVKQRAVSAWPLKIGTIGYPETSVTVYHPNLCNTPEGWTSPINRGGSLKSWQHADRMLTRAKCLRRDTLVCEYGTVNCVWRHVGDFNITVVWNATPCHLVERYQVFGGIRFHPHLDSSETSVQSVEIPAVQSHKATQFRRFFITSNCILVRSLLGVALRDEITNQGGGWERGRERDRERSAAK